MIGGEIHYWRVQRPYWEPILDAARSLGIEVVGTYVPWRFHETAEGQYDFSLLNNFLDLLDARGFQVFIRPGPYIYAEWHNMGLPDHAVPYHKLHPEFQRKAAQWIQAVMNEIRPRLGTLITVVQADNEIDPMIHFYGEDLGFARWLRERYGAIDRLNAAWGTKYTSFDEPIPTLAPFQESPRFLDGCRYQYDLANQYAKWVVAEYRKYAGDVPVLLNTWPGVNAQNWRDFADQADLYGIDPYPTNECRNDFRYFRERLRLLRAITKFPCLTEFGSGIWHGMPNRDYTPDHYRLTAMTALAGGVKGWNWYMLVDRDNWTGSPINERGVIRPELGDAFRFAVSAFKKFRDAPPPETSCAVTWSWRYHQIAQMRKQDVDDPLPAVLHDMGIEYDFVDVDHDFEAPRLLFVCGEIEQPERLWKYVEEGGNLVTFQRLLPGMVEPDGTSHPFAERLEVLLPPSVPEAGRMPAPQSVGRTPAPQAAGGTPGPQEAFVSNRPVFHYRQVPGAPVTARQLPWRIDEDQRRFMELAVGRTYTTGYHQKHGQGTITVVGCAPCREAILAIHRFFHLDIPVLPLTPGVHAGKRGDHIIVLNPGEARTARIQVGGEVRTVDLPRCSGVIL